MFLTIDQIKKHLNIDAEYTDDDNYLMDLAEVAEKAVQKHIDTKLQRIVEEEGELPKPLLHAMLLMIGNLYNSRESVSFGVTTTEVPLSYQYLLSLYKNYNNTLKDS